MLLELFILLFVLNGLYAFATLGSCGVYRIPQRGVASRNTRGRSRRRARTLRLVHINVWSGSTYEMDWKVLRFVPYEASARREARFESLVQQLRELDADVITLNECLPSRRTVMSEFAEIRRSIARE
jgi:hypothetical protein